VTRVASSEQTGCVQVGAGRFAIAHLSGTELLLLVINLARKRMKEQAGDDEKRKDDETVPSTAECMH
jgi:hypothetical protein